MSAYLLIKENSFPLPNVLLSQKKTKNKEKNNKNLLFYFGKLKTCQVSSLASFLGRFFRLGLH